MAVGDGSELEAERQKLQAANKLQIARTRELAQAERAARRFQEEQRKLQQQAMLLENQRIRAEGERGRAAAAEKCTNRMAELRRRAQNHVIERDQIRAEDKRNDKNMHMLRDRVASLRAQAVWWEDSMRQKFYEKEEKFGEWVLAREKEENPAFGRIDSDKPIIVQ